MQVFCVGDRRGDGMKNQLKLCKLFTLNRCIVYGEHGRVLGGTGKLMYFDVNFGLSRL